MRTRVKICGFTRVEEAVHAAQLGVDAIGLVFYPPSPRCVDIATARAIVNALPAFTSVVALFVNEQEKKIRDVLTQVPIDCIQFHGDEAPTECRQFGYRYIKAIAMRDHTDLTALAVDYADADGLLVDTYHPDVKGGTGHTFNWAKVPAKVSLPIILAGGLTPDNVAEAIRCVRPYAVDVSSGVEKTKGLKDITKMTAFLTAANLIH